MKITLEERFRRSLLRWGKKNKFCGFCAIPVIALGMFFFHASAYLAGNGKRFAMLGMSFLLFAVYSSFSFPSFISGGGDGWNPISDEAKDIVLAKEAEIDLEKLAVLGEEEDFLEDTDVEPAHDMGNMTTYSAEEILELNRPGGTSGKAETPSAENTKFARDDWRVLLVNKQHSIPEGYEEQVPLGTIMTMKGIMYCDERIIDELLNMFSEARDDGVALQICSPYRDLEKQRTLFDKKLKYYLGMGLSYIEAYQIASRTVTVPNASEHQLGLALDIVSDTYVSLDEGYAKTKAGKWLAENCYRFGFILRYPKDREDVTGIRYEPWHFRYVGVDAATLITQNGLTLEEFWETEEYWEEP